MQALMSSVKEVCNALTSAVGDNQAVLNAEGYAECPDCGAHIHCSTVGIQNPEKRHQGSKTCLESEAKRDKNAKMKKNRTHFSFFNWLKPSLVPSMVPSVPLIQSPALPWEKTPNTKPVYHLLQKSNRQAQKVKRLLRHLALVGVRKFFVRLVALMGACVEWWWILVLSQTWQSSVNNLDVKLDG